MSGYMKGVSKIIIAAIICVVIVVAAVGYYFFLMPKAPEKSEILVGASICLTGNLGKTGQDILKAYELFIEIVNEDGGVYVKDLGRKLPLRLIYYDDKSDTSTAATNTERLILVDGVDFLLGSHGSMLGVAMSNVANKYKVPLIGPLGSTLTYELNRHNYTFMSFPDVREPTPEQKSQLEQMYGAAAVKEFIEGRPQMTKLPFELFAPLLGGSIKLAIIVDDTDLGLMMKDEVHKLVEAGEGVYQNVEIVYETIFQPGLSDFSAIILAAKESGAEYLLSEPSVTDAVTLMTQMKELGWHPKVVQLQRATSAAELVTLLGKDLAAGVCNIGTNNPLQDPEFQELMQRWRVKYNEEPTTTQVGNCLSPRLLVEAIEKAGSIDREKVREALSNMDTTIYGGKIKFPLGLGHSVVTVTVMQYDNNGNQKYVYPPDQADATVIFPKPWD